MRRLTLALARWHSRRPHSYVVDGAPLIVLPGVFDPVMTKVGAWLSGLVRELALPGERWLELGAGSGVVACALARSGATVVATDIDEQAARNTRFNAELTRIHVEVRVGDLYAPVAGEQFDGIVANLPFWPGTAAGMPLGTAFAAGEDFELLRRFVAGYPDHAPRAYTVLSEEFLRFPEARAALGQGARLVRRARYRGEWLNLFELGARR
ncbi:MAG: methyltransferase domain-containing protein [Myxococcales bacterium]|nr:methyltransferase domain-containing protein [Myxococcales bacterium]